MMNIHEISAFSTKEAIEIAKSNGINVVKNVTLSFNNIKDKIINHDDFLEFIENIMDKNKISKEGDGCIIVKSPGSSDTRKCPYQFINNKSKGISKKIKIFEIRKCSNNEVVGTGITKNEAAHKAKKLIKHYKEDLKCVQCYYVMGDNGIAFNLKYTPSINTKKGTYIVFGN